MMWFIKKTALERSLQAHVRYVFKIDLCWFYKIDGVYYTIYYYLFYKVDSVHYVIYYYFDLVIE